MRIRSRHKKNLRVKAALLVIFVFMLVPLSVFAREDTDVCKVTEADVSAKKAIEVLVPIPGITYKVNNNHYTKDMACYIVGIYRYFAGVAGILATVMIMFGGVKYVISFGNPQKTADAKDTITGALMGLILVLGSFSILYLINPNLTTFNIPRIEHIDEMKWSNCGNSASFSSELDECVLECPAGYSLTSCTMCKEALSSHDVVWSNDICTSDETNLGIGKTMRVEPGLADAIQQAIGDTMYVAKVAGEIYLFGGPAAATFKSVVGKMISTSLKIESIELITDVDDALTNNPMYQGKTVFTDPKSICCAKDNTEAGVSVCRFGNGFGEIWEGQCSGLLPCKDTTPCGEFGTNGCWGIYAKDGICTWIWGEHGGNTYKEAMSTVEGDPHYSGWAQVIPTNLNLMLRWNDLRRLCTPYQIAAKPVKQNVYCAGLDVSYKDNEIHGIGSSCPEGFQCVLTHQRNPLLHDFVDIPFFSVVDSETCIESDWKEGNGWGEYVSDYSLFRKTGEADREYWLAKGGHCLPITQ